MPDEKLPNYVFGPLDVMPLVELSNEAYDIARQHPSAQTVFRKWMRKFVEFMQAHEFTKPPEGALTKTDNKYLELVREGTAKAITDKMKDQ